MLLKFDFSNFIGYGQKNVADMFFIWFLLSWCDLTSKKTAHGFLKFRILQKVVHA
jgi:hypothetical protein